MEFLFNFAIEALNIAQQHVSEAPYIFFGLLLLGGLNIPVSEDLIVLTGGLMASQSPEYLWKIYIFIYLGAFISDLMVFWIFGKFLGKKIKNFKFLKRTFTQHRIERISGYIDNYGILTIFVGRMIPFGMRNLIFFAAGFGHMNGLKFFLTDALACLATTGIYFYLYFTFGHPIINMIKKANTSFFIIILTIVFLYLIKYFLQRKVKEPSS